MPTLFWVSYGLLWVLFVLMAIGLIGLYYHFGQIYLSSPDGKADEGPAVGGLVGGLDSVDLSGDAVVLPRLGEPMLLVFAATSCELCGRLRDGIREYAESSARAVPVYVLCHGHGSGVQEWAQPLAGLPGVRVIPDPKGRQAMRYGVTSTPFCVAVDGDGEVQAKGNVNDLAGLHHYSGQALGLEVIDTRKASQ